MATQSKTHNPDATAVVLGDEIVVCFSGYHPAVYTKPLNPDASIVDQLHSMYPDRDIETWDFNTYNIYIK